MNSSESNYQPDEFERGVYKTLFDKHAILLVKHRRRSRSPLKFVEAFHDYEEALAVMENVMWPGIEVFVQRMKASAELLRPEMQKCLPEANAQRERNEFWDQVYNPPPRLFEGGRADGNSR